MQTMQLEMQPARGETMKRHFDSNLKSGWESGYLGAVSTW